MEGKKDVKQCIYPKHGEAITCTKTKNTYYIGDKIGEGNFSFVYSCNDVWKNDLAVKVLKPLGTYEAVLKSANEEFGKLILLRHPNITYVYDAFEYRNTFYIITERCYGTIDNLFELEKFDGMAWLLPIARCLLQSVHYLHLNNFVHQDIHLGNVFTKLVKGELLEEPKIIHFKLGDLGVGKFVTEISELDLRAQWILPPEILNVKEFGPLDNRIDIYHIGLLLLQLAYSKILRFNKEEILSGKPREMALKLQHPFNFALEKALRRHVIYRTNSALELWRDLNSVKD